MRKILLLLFTLITLATSAQYLEYKVPAVGDRVGMVVLQPTKLIDTVKYRLIIGLPGIGNRGTGSLRALDTLLGTGDFAALESRVKLNKKFILIEVQPLNNYEHGEVDEAYQWARGRYGDSINWNKVYLTGVSLGGGGSQRYLAYNTSASNLFAASVIVCSGPNQFFVTNGDAGYKNIATYASQRPVWFLHSKDDPIVAPWQSTDLTIAKIKAINSKVNVKRTLYKYEKHGAWVRAYGYNPAATPTVAEDYNDPLGGALEFFELNELGTPMKFLPRLSDPVAVPVPIRSLLKTDTIRQRITYDTTLTKIIYFYSDNTYEVR